MAQRVRDQLTQEFGNAVSDIRTKLFEEAWCGRPATIALDHAPGMTVPQLSQASEFDEFWGGLADSRGPKPQQPREIEPKEREPEITPALEEELAIDGLRRWIEKHEYDKDFDIER
ncbi:MAG: hypothetical protein WDM81_20975 [Rhizomicrobium sp.]